MDEMNLASEILHDYKQGNKRMFVIIIIMIVMHLLTVGGFLWYITLPIEDSVTEYSQEVEDSEYINQSIGGDINGEGEAESKDS